MKDISSESQFSFQRFWFPRRNDKTGKRFSEVFKKIETGVPILHQSDISGSNRFWWKTNFGLLTVARWNPVSSLRPESTSAITGRPKTGIFHQRSKRTRDVTWSQNRRSGFCFWKPCENLFVLQFFKYLKTFYFEVTKWLSDERWRKDVPFRKWKHHQKGINSNNFESMDFPEAPLAAATAWETHKPP